MGGPANLEEAALCIFSSLLLVCLARQSYWFRAGSWAWLTHHVWLKGIPKWRKEKVTLSHSSVTEEMEPVLWAGKSLKTRGSLVLMRQIKNPCLGSTQGDFWPPAVFVPPLRLASTMVSCSPSNSLGSQLVPSRGPSLQNFKWSGWLHLMYSQYLGISSPQYPWLEKGLPIGWGVPSGHSASPKFNGAGCSDFQGLSITMGFLLQYFRSLFSGWGSSSKACGQECGVQRCLAVDTSIMTLSESEVQNKQILRMCKRLDLCGGFEKRSKVRP